MQSLQKKQQQTERSNRELRLRASMMGRRSIELRLLLLLSSCLVLVSELIHASLVLNDLSPPPGNSLQLKVKTCNGRQIYGCVGGKLKLLNATAELVDVVKSSIVGSYSYNRQSGHTGGTWLLSNSPEEVAESGYPGSQVSAKIVASERIGKGCSNILAEAVNHRYIGTASLVSYIQGFPTRAYQPIRYKCIGQDVREVPFEAEYRIWSQDRVPPVDTPAQLLVPNGRLVEGFYAKGVLSYIYNGTTWIQRKWRASLYDVPGGVLVGKYYRKPGYGFVWEFFDPNGFSISSSSSSSQVQMQVTENCIPWTLFVVSKSWGNGSFPGPVGHVQMVSTRGGMPPCADGDAASPLQPGSTCSLPFKGQIYNSTFSAIFWLYSKL